MTKEIEKILYKVQSPGQYCGGEYGSITYKEAQDFSMGISYPDLYSIGMSNQAVRILYNMANRVEGVQCERVFAPMADMERQLRETETSYFTLETQIPLYQLDMLAFSIGYELCFTNMLNIIQLGNIPLFYWERGEKDPILMAGGPTVTNPLPYSEFIDVFYIGEGESDFQSLLCRIKDMKKSGYNRKDILTYIKKQPYIWFDGKKEKTRITKDENFGKGRGASSAYPVPTIEAVQDHGVVEIMRGCPNKCRFCHAGVYYRPKREKDWARIIEEIDVLVYECGYKDITLSSLSSGDFNNINQLISLLYERYKKDYVSFSLPSLRVNSINLDLIENLSKGKKSGLTFAVEAAREDWQRGLNKDVSEDNIIEILREAKGRGWRQAKFYFMLGLPMSIDKSEEDDLIAYINRIQRKSNLNISVNIGIFIPKTFTPFQDSHQLSEDIGLRKILYIKKNINNKRVKISFHSPFASLVEGTLSRGDKKAGRLFLHAFNRGARFDSWDDKLDRNLWKEIINDAEWDVVKETTSDHKDFLELYDSLDLSVSLSSLKSEKDKAMEFELGTPCQDNCPDHCGLCHNNLRVREASPINSENIKLEKQLDIGYYPYLLKLEKRGKAKFIGHLDFYRAFERATYRSGIPLKMSEGYNPKPKIEFANPLPLGAESEEEWVLLELVRPIDSESKKDELNRKIIEGIQVCQIIALDVIPGQKKYSLMKHWGGCDWIIEAEKKLLVHIKKILAELLLEENVKMSFEFLKDDDSSVTIRHYFKQGKVAYNSLNKFLRVHFEDNFSNLRMRRIKSWAMTSRGILDYADFLKP